MKKIIAMILCLVTLSNPIISMGDTQNSPSEKDYMAYSLDAIQQYVEICSIIPEQELSITQPIQIYNDADDNNRIVFLYDGDSCIGMMAITSYNDTFISSFIPSKFPQLSGDSISNTSLSLFVFEESLYLLYNDSYTVLTGNDSLHELSGNNTPDFSGYTSSLLNRTTINTCSKQPVPSRVTAIGNELDVDIVGNSTSPDTGLGLCWAASLAAIIRYRTNSHSLTAIQLYNQLKNAHPAWLNGYPKGTKKWEKWSFDLYNLPKTYVSHGTTFPTIRTIIDDHRPIYCGLDQIDENNNTVVSHAVDIVGYGAAYGYCNFILMDPNILSNYVVVLGNGTGNTPFIYVTSYGYTFNKMTCYIY